MGSIKRESWGHRLYLHNIGHSCNSLQALAPLVMRYCAVHYTVGLYDRNKYSYRVPIKTRIYRYSYYLYHNIV